MFFLAGGESLCVDIEAFKHYTVLQNKLKTVEQQIQSLTATPQVIVNPYPASIFCPEDVVCFLCLLPNSSELQVKNFFHQDKFLSLFYRKIPKPFIGPLNYPLQGPHNHLKDWPLICLA